MATPVHGGPDGPFAKGAELHSRVPAERWSVTKRDLKHLRRRARKFLRQKRIVPTERDPFDPGDHKYGPTIYTITDQLIKPVTAEAGGMSWALMRHPQGLKCDLFITHAWQEGVFEFIGKVLSGWPRGRRHAWCCMLAIPQHLDISGLISTPADSPFAKALAAAQGMLVVPNRHGSIYTRLWCVYEAYLAYQLDKVIQTASASPWPKFLRSLPLMCFCSAGGVVSNLWWHASILPGLIVVYMFTYYPLVLVSMVDTDMHRWRFWNCVGCFWSAGFFTSAYRCPMNVWHDTKEFADLGGSFMAIQMQISILSNAFFTFSELDRIQYETSYEEGRQLMRSYSGSVQYAQCTSAGDAVAIMGEIGDHIVEVDRTIEVLVHAGMATSALSEAVALGVDLERFACIGVAFMVLLAPDWPEDRSDSHAPEDQDGIFVDLGDSNFSDAALALKITAGDGTGAGALWIQTSGMALWFVWVLIYYCSRQDMRIWSYMVLKKCFIMIDWPIEGILLILWKMGHTTGRTYMLAKETGQFVVWVIVIILSVAHINRLARIPRIGAPLAQVIVAQNWQGVKKAWRLLLSPPGSAASAAASDSSSSSTDEESGSPGDACAESPAASPAASPAENPGAEPTPMTSPV